MKRRRMTQGRKRLAAVERAAEQRGTSLGERRGYDRARREADAKYERLVIPDGNGVAWLGERPRHHTLRVPMFPDSPDFLDALRCPRMGEVETATFEAVSKVQTIEVPGKRGPLDRRRVLVRWVDWEFRGLS